MDNTDNRKKIVEKAIEMFNSLGCKAVTMDQIASSLHISKRTLYELFDTKEDLLMACLIEVHRRIGEKRLEIYKQTNDPLLLSLYIVKSTVMQNDLYSRLLKETGRYYPELNDRILDTYGYKFDEVLQSIFRQAAEHNDLRENVDIDAAVASISNFIRQRCQMDKGEELGQDYKTLSDMLYTYLRGLLSVHAIERYDKREQEFKQLMEASESVNP